MRLKKNLIVVLNAKNHRFHLRLLKFNPSGGLEIEAAARIERKSFFACTRVLSNEKSSCKKDWEWKAEIAAQIFLLIKNNRKKILII